MGHTQKEVRIMLYIVDADITFNNVNMSWIICHKWNGWHERTLYDTDISTSAHLPSEGGGDFPSNAGSQDGVIHSKPICNSGLRPRYSSRDLIAEEGTIQYCTSRVR